MVEFALSSMLLALMLGLLIDFSRAFYFETVLQNASYQGARHGSWFVVSDQSDDYYYDSAIQSAVDQVLNDAGLPSSVLQNPTTTCPTPSDGNSYYNPPYAASSYPTTPNTVWLYICYNNTPGTDYTANPNGYTHAGERIHVILTMRYGLALGFIQNSIPPVNMAGDFQMRVQGA